MWLGGVSVFGSFAPRYSSEAVLCGNTRNICHKQTPSRYDWKTVESDLKHQITHSLTDLSIWERLSSFISICWYLIYQFGRGWLLIYPTAVIWYISKYGRGWVLIHPTAGIRYISMGEAEYLFIQLLVSTGMGDDEYLFIQLLVSTGMGNDEYFFI